ncbi:MAG: aminotransferase class V-fold PLP-dependent enzyme [Lachnospiraceae bacterium]|nr:aminotransferase class V-fold PLP-dependent enzyme [Lachnospiraceae bacterium]
MDQNKANDRLYFASDYMEGAHPAILQRLLETNMVHSAGYGLDTFSESARARIRRACNAPEADVHFLVGGTQTNATVIGSILRPYQGVIAAESGHISTHEAGAIEAGGHKVLALPHTMGKLDAASVADCVKAYREDGNHDHMVMPGLVYISQPTEFGTLYSLRELTEISRVCHEAGIPLYVDGARLAYALACPDNDVTLADLARLCDAFYIGGTKCGALLGEAVVLPRHDFIPHFFTLIKRGGALLAKGWVAGLQFDTLFSPLPGKNGENENGSGGSPLLYEEIGRTAIEAAGRIRNALLEKGYDLPFDCPTNQLFIAVDRDRKEYLEQHAELSFWEKLADGRTVLRICTSWATSMEDVDCLLTVL